MIKESCALNGVWRYWSYIYFPLQVPRSSIDMNNPLWSFSVLLSLIGGEQLPGCNGEPMRWIVNQGQSGEGRGEVGMSLFSPTLMN